MTEPQIGIDYIGVGVGAVIFNDQGQFLVAQRGPLARNEQGKWEIPGGKVEYGETIIQALKREIKEEINVEIEVLELLDVCDHILPDEKQHWVSPTYMCRIVQGEPQNMEPGKCQELRWVSLTEAEKLPLSMVTKQDVSCLKTRAEKITFGKVCIMKV